jgi:hypothetical protein
VGEPELESFHDACRNLSRRGAMLALLEEFRRGNIADPDRTGEDSSIRTHLGEFHGAWDDVFSGFPECRRRRRSMGWEWERGRRDAYLRSLIATWVPADPAGRRLIVNPATVFGRHARAVAASLPSFEVIGTDIDPRGNRLYATLSPFHRGLENYRFVRESIYEPDPDRRPAAVIFFGACGSVSDGAMDYALTTRSPFLICRTCCHDNIGGNTRIVKRPGGLNRFFRFKNRGFASGKVKGVWPYVHYFSKRYGLATYPRSRLARELMDSETILAVARNSVDSDVCRALIDLDRCQYLDEHGYDVLYRDELFFAHRRDGGLAGDAA